MKLKKILFQQSKLIKLQLIKFKTYKENQNITEESFQYLELHLKKALQIVYNYHFYNKTIFFIGLPLEIQQIYSKLFFQTSHLFISKSIWVNGIITNKSSKSTHQNFNRIKRNPDLIVLFNKKIDYSALEEAVKLKIPIIAITTNTKFDKNILYLIYSDFYYLNKRLNYIYIYLLNSILKKRQNK